MTLRIGTRSSPLALVQANYVAGMLTAAGNDVSLVHITTMGDTSTAPLRELGGVGVFTSALRQALIEESIDLAVHSYKDVPTAPHSDVQIVAVPVREDPRDVLVSRESLSLDELPPRAKIGTGSPRRSAQIRGSRPDLQVVDIRGNVDSRLARVTSGEFDGVVLAYAGMARLGREDEITEIFPIDVMLPAPAQGALAIECRTHDSSTQASVAILDNPEAHASVRAERAFLAFLEAGCSAPVGAWAEICDVFGEKELHLHGGIFGNSPEESLRRSITTSLADASQAGQTLAAALLATGAPALLEATS